VALDTDRMDRHFFVQQRFEKFQRLRTFVAKLDVVIVIDQDGVGIGGMGGADASAMYRPPPLLAMASVGARRDHH
jgi:hypothetical protein